MWLKITNFINRMWLNITSSFSRRVGSYSLVLLIAAISIAIGWPMEKVKIMDDFLSFLGKYELIINFFIAIIPIAITGLVIYIAFQQSSTNRKKLKLDLFDKRFLIYKSTRVFVGKVIQNRKASRDEQREFLLGTRGSEFLFDADMKTYIDDVWNKSIDLENWSADELTSTHSTERSAHMNWFSTELSSLDDKFKTFLQVGH